jgi:dihydrofolate reductase
MGFSDPVLSKVIVKTITAGRYDLLLGRRTYDIWAPYWPRHNDHPIGRAFNRAAKFVATRRRRPLKWENSQCLAGEVVKAVRQLKAAKGPDIHVWGSGNLLQTLMAAQLVDEHRLWIYPIVLGKGRKLFASGLPTQRLALVSSRRTAAGILLNTYRPKRTG